MADYREGFALSIADAGTGSGVVCASSLLATRSTERLSISKEYKSELPDRQKKELVPDFWAAQAVSRAYWPGANLIRSAQARVDNSLPLPSLGSQLLVSQFHYR